MTWLSDDAVTRLRTLADVPDLTGTRYRVVRELTRGGMGVVYECKDKSLDRRVAVKRMREEIHALSMTTLTPDERAERA